MSDENNLGKFLWHVIVPILVGLAILFLEYWSGWFHQSLGVKRAWLFPAGSLTAISIALLVVTFLAAMQSLLVWLQPAIHVREDFAFVGTLLIFSLSASIAVCVVNGIMPWSAINIAMRKLINGESSQPETTKWSDYAFLFLLYLIVVWAVLRNHAHWSGLKSIDQYRQEQRNEHASLFVDGFREFRRIIQRKPLLRTYDEKETKDFITQLEPVSDSRAWRDQAKELLCLSSPSYAFDPDTSWHDLEGCWVGSNVNTNESVFLFPSQSEATDDEVDRFLQIAQSLSDQKESMLGEIVIAVRERVHFKPTRPGVRLKCIDESELLDNLVDFKDYFTDIRRRATITTLPDSNLVLTQVYVPSQIHVGIRRTTADVEEFLNAWVGDPSQKHLALLGEYGQGKSTAALMWAYHQVSDPSVSSGRIPLVIELRGTSPRNLTPLQMLGAWSARYNLNAQALMRLLTAGRLTLIFEGFDEMALVGDASMRLNHFRTLWQFAYPRAKLLITGRPNFFLDEEEMKAALGISKPVANAPYCEAIRLKPFTPDQIYQALRSHNNEVRTQIHELAKENERFRDIVSRPSLLHIVSALWEREGLFEKADELTSAVVMDLFVRQSYRRQGLKEKDSPDFMALTTAEREYFMEGIAACMGCNKLPNQISGRQLNDLIRELIAVIPDSISTKSKAISGETKEPLRSRIENNEYGRDHVMTDVRACGLLVDDPSSTGTFRFGHKSFMEYLFAVVIGDGIQKQVPEKTRAIFKAINARIEDILNLPVAVEFLCELLVRDAVVFERSAEQNEADKARHMLQMILGPGYFRFAMRRLLFLFEALGSSFRRTSILSILQKDVTTTSTAATLMLTFSMMPLLTAFGLVMVAPRLSPHPPKRLLLLVSMVLFSFSAFSILSMMLYLANDQTVIRKRVGLWARLCHGMGLPSEVGHRVLGTWIIPRVKKEDLYKFVETILY